jgi:hypothetical protein
LVLLRFAGEASATESQVNKFYAEVATAQVRQTWSLRRNESRNSAILIQDYQNHGNKSCYNHTKPDNQIGKPMKWMDSQPVELSHSSTCDARKQDSDDKMTWDNLRIKFCRKLNQDYPRVIPAELDKLLKLNYPGGLGTDGNLRDPRTRLNAGEGKQGLVFDPTVARELFLKLRAALLLYYEGDEQLLLANMDPRRDDPDFPAFIDAISDRFARKLVHGGRFVIGGIGDSTMAGAGNCHYDTFMRSMERQLSPFFTAVGLKLEVRNAGHNGFCQKVYSSSHHMTNCAGSLLGEDLDILLIGFPMVHGNVKKPDPNSARNEEFMELEDVIRRALVSGVAVHIVAPNTASKETYFKYMRNYTRLGVGFGGAMFEREFWWPTGVRRAEYGRVTDMFCHVSTRAGSVGKLHVNWHPGPLGHELWGDQLTYHWAAVMIAALEKIETAGSGGKVPKQVWPDTFPPPPKLGKAQLCSLFPEFANVHPQCYFSAPLQLGFKKCGAFINPIFSRWGDLRNWTRPETIGSWSWHYNGPCAPYGGVCDTCDGLVHADSLSQCCYQTQRSHEACANLDTSHLLTGTGPVTLHILAKSMKVGAITVCGKELDGMSYTLEGVEEKIIITNFPDYRNGCHMVTKELSTQELSRPLALMITPVAGKIGSISYIRTD